MATETLQPGAIGAKSSRTTGTTTNAPTGETQQQHRQWLVHLDAAIVATENMTQATHLKTVRKTRCSKNEKQYAIGCESIHIDVDDGQLPIWCSARVHRELREQCIIACNGKPPWSTKALGGTVREITHDNGFSSGIFADGFPVTRPREWTKQAWYTLVMATESYIVEVIAHSHFRSSN